MYSVGFGKTAQELSNLTLKAKQRQGNLELFTDEEESQYSTILSGISNSQIQVIGPELIYGRLFDKLGYNLNMFCHLVLTRLYNPRSKLKRNQFKQAEEPTKRMYQIKIVLPSSGKEKLFPLNMDEKQRELYTLILKNP